MKTLKTKSKMPESNATNHSLFQIKAAAQLSTQIYKWGADQISD
jgi:hypothetical protein